MKNTISIVASIASIGVSVVQIRKGFKKNRRLQQKHREQIEALTELEKYAIAKAEGIVAERIRQGKYKTPQEALDDFDFEIIVNRP